MDTSRHLQLLLLTSLLLTSPRVWAASSANYAITQDAFSSGAGLASSANFRLTGSSVGEATTGEVASVSYRVTGGYALTAIELPPGSRTITVEGTIDDPTATVMVNSLLAAVVGNAWAATGVPIVEGENTITVTATDPLGNSVSQTIAVHLDTRPPARPTVERGGLGNNVAPNTFLTTAATVPLSGTKVPGTSVWVNGVEVVPLDGAAVWTAAYPLQEGDNVLTIVTKDAAGNTSTSEVIVIVVDNLPPVITVDFPPQPYKTNLTPLVMQGRVDDRLTSVQIDGVSPTRNVLQFQAEFPLVVGANSFTITATSPLGHIATKQVNVTRGTIPTITNVVPADASKVYAGQPVTLDATATDAEGDPVEYQLLRNGQVVADWTATPAQTWVPVDAEAGVQAIEVRARDAFGGVASQPTELYVVRPPVSPP